VTPSMTLRQVALEPCAHPAPRAHPDVGFWDTHGIMNEPTPIDVRCWRLWMG
jgi:hypothetical protein